MKQEQQLYKKIPYMNYIKSIRSEGMYSVYIDLEIMHRILRAKSKSFNMIYKKNF